MVTILNICNVFRSGTVSVSSLALVVTEIAGKDIVSSGLGGDVMTVTDTIHWGVNTNTETLSSVATLNTVRGMVTGKG